MTLRFPDGCPIFFGKPSNLRLIPESIVLLKTLSGCASAAAEALDSYGIPHVIGSVAGDNTIMFVTDDPENSPIVVEFLNNMLKK